EDLLGQPRRGGCGDPERALMRAMLLDAVLCLIGQSAPAVDRPRLAAEARAWIVSRSREWIYAFERVCQALDFDAGYLRPRLLPPADAQAGGGAQHARPATAVRSIRKSTQRRRRAVHFVPRLADASA